MTSKTQNDSPSGSISNITKGVLHGFVLGAVSRLSEILKYSPLDWEDDSQLERGTDGHYRIQKNHFWKCQALLTDDWLFSLPYYDKCIEQLESDLVVGPHLDCLVGTNNSSTIIQSNQILKSLI